MSDAVLARPDVVAPTFLRAPPWRPPPDVESPLNWLAARFALALAPARSWRAARWGARAAARAAELAAMSDADFAAATARARKNLRRSGMKREPLAEALAVAAETARRALGAQPFPAQLACAAALARGAVAEMETGEGKTLAAFLAAAAYAFAGRGVHVVTSNDYLAARDAATLAPAYAALGLTVGVVVGGDETRARRAAYRADIVYISSKEAAFDYLRDRLARPAASGGGRLAGKLARVFGASGEEPLQANLDVALIDEIDSVLVDEAVTPLLISANHPGDITQAVARDALDFAAGLSPGRDFTVDPLALSAELTPRGEDRLARFCKGRDGPWRVRLIREELARAAIGAVHVLRRDQHYLVRDGKIALIDQESGRLTPDRRWSHGLSLMVETKEGCASSGEMKSLASISFQRFFRQYGAVCGMSGTVREVAAELHAVYGLAPVWIARRLPLRRVVAKRRVFRTRETLWREAARVAAALQKRGQPALVAVRSVREADRASAALAAAGVAHRVLSAAQDGAEAEIVAEAGQPGIVTVVTNMAGRGTDIKLGAGVAALGGLAVLICERHESRRVDRQLVGRCARQGDPGLVLEFVSAQDGALRTLDPLWLRLLARWPGLTAAALWRAQRLAEAQKRVARLQLLRRDEGLARIMAFAGGLD
ncbi:preprotein translocase subunit SecA [Rhodoblastus acidophilus]|uniref:preprotein translocase subunit SecA n=1 Tax=Rhodoblastus acidophilus TaxID=1074 RepID=UPI00222425C7|nr:DEAD/DEAH box helicase [Rhodoblastus acidophilus]MCW2284565.1 preprotein translocase subunit SecA [Rhodoblastus acidophilus]MCW2333518.1 preprotein translocase subunit SecA [Rhodoblastus acidophilus]